VKARRAPRAGGRADRGRNGRKLEKGLGYRDIRRLGNRERRENCAKGGMVIGYCVIGYWGMRLVSINNQQSTINNQQSTINNQQSTINNQQSTINNQQSTIINHQSSIINHQSSIINHQSSIINHQSSIEPRSSHGMPGPWPPFPLRYLLRRGYEGQESYGGQVGGRMGAMRTPRPPCGLIPAAQRTWLGRNAMEAKSVPTGYNWASLLLPLSPSPPVMLGP